MADQASFTMVCDGCVEIAVAVAAGSPTVTVVDTNRTLGTVTAGNSQTFNDYLVNGNTATVSIPNGNTVASGKITGTIKYTVCPTPTPPPPTPSATIAPTPSPSGGVVPTPTPGVPGYLAGGGACSFATTWPAFGPQNQYELDDQWYICPANRVITITNGGSGPITIKYWTNADCFNTRTESVSNWDSGVLISALPDSQTSGGDFAFQFAFDNGLYVYIY